MPHRNIPGALPEENYGLLKNDLSRSLIFSIGSTIAAMGLLAIFFVYQINSLIWLAEEADQSHLVVRRSINTEKTLIDMETGVRGYYITNNPVFLEPFERGEKVYREKIESLKQLTAQKPMIKDNVYLIESLVGEWLKLQKQAIFNDQGQPRRVSEKEASENETKGKILMDQVRESSQDVINSETEVYQGLKERTTHNAQMVIIYGLGIGLFFSAFLIWNLRKQIITLFNVFNSNLVKLQSAQSEIVELNSNLEKKVSERTALLKATTDELEAFSYSVSHDLRAPLRGIDGFSLALIEDYTSVLDETGKSYLNFIREGVQKMGYLIDDLLRLSRINRSNLDFSEFDIAELFKEVISSSHNSLEFKTRTPEFEIRVMGKHLVSADRALMKIAIENLVSNAIKYSSKAEKPKVIFGEKETESGPVFFVKDNGVGFDMQYYSKLFGAFQRLHLNKEFKGSGIGLATVKRVLQRHGGDVWAEAVVGEGATFYFRLPAHAYTETETDDKSAGEAYA